MCSTFLLVLVDTDWDIDFVVSLAFHTKYVLFILQYPQTLNGSRKREDSLHSHLKGTARKTQANLAGVAQGSGKTTGSTISTGNTQDNTAVIGFSASDASGNFAFTSGASGSVETTYGGANANGGSSISGSSIGKSEGNESGYGDVTFSGSSTASGDGKAMGLFGPLQQSDTGATQASGSGTGTLNVAGSGFTGTAIGPALEPGQPYKTAYSSGSGTAKTAAGGSATAFNMLASTSGLGSGMATGTATGVLDSRSIYAVESASTATGTFNGSGFGSYGNTPSQPYTAGSVKGNGGGGGTAAVKGAVTGFPSLYGEYVNTNGQAAFNSNGGGAGFVKGKNGGADGSGSGGASGTVVGIAMDLPPTDKTYGDLDFSATSAVNGGGAFSGGFSTPESPPGPTGGTGSSNGALSIFANSGGGIYNDGLVTSGGSAVSFGGGEASASNVYGKAGGLGSGSTEGSAISGLTVLSGEGDGTGTSMGNFSTFGSGVFGP
jgi:hypothetical protein